MIWPSIIAVAVIVLAFVDWVYLRKQYYRVFFLELMGFMIVLCAVVKPDWLTFVAHKLGIGRGVDLLIYTVLIWLFRESILGRIRYHRQRSQLTRLVRQIAKSDVVRINAEKH
jgi:small membrane protein